jgi:GTP cyclohydrolase IA
MTMNNQCEVATNSEILSCSDKETIKSELELKYPGAIEHVKAILKLVGDDPDREGLRDTPYRVVKSWLEIYSGYSDNEDKLKTFFEDDLGDQTDEIVICKDISFSSVCEHHMLPFTGTCSIGYLPNKRVIGVSKLVRLVEFYSHRLQIQEKLCSQIADKLVEILQPQGVGIIIEAQHLCMTSRGVKNYTAKMVTSAMRGKFRTQSQTRQEFLSLIKA